MIYLNYNNLDDETQQHLLSVSKEEIESRFGNDLKAYANKHHIDYNTGNAGHSIPPSPG